MTDTARRTLIRFGPVIYGPTVLFALGEGAVLPILPVLAARLGADLATAALVASALVVGQLCGNLPAGWLTARIGERATMIGAGIVTIAGAAGIVLAPSIAVLAASVFVIGLCAAAFGLARHSFMVTRVPIAFRARALSLLGGTFRLGMFVGPFVAAALVGITGTETAAAWFFAGCLAATVLLLWLGPDPELWVDEADAAAAGASFPFVPTAPADDSEDTGEAVTGSIPVTGRPGVFATMRAYRGLLARLGLAAASLSAVRSARQVVVPLWGVGLGLDATTIALVVGVSGAIDFALFYASGQVMDRFGRLWAALPAMLLMGAGFVALAATSELTTADLWYAAFAMVLGVGNGLSSGILLTLGADVAPRDDPAPFLGSWRTLTDAGGAAAPLLVSAITAAFSLAWAAAFVGIVALVGAAGFARWVPRFVPRHRDR